MVVATPARDLTAGANDAAVVPAHREIDRVGDPDDRPRLPAILRPTIAKPTVAAVLAPAEHPPRRGAPARVGGSPFELNEAGRTGDGDAPIDRRAVAQHAERVVPPHRGAAV